MNPYHQGQLDYFCAIYSVINALRLTHGTGLAESREIFGTALRELSARPCLWEALLNNTTDHYWVVEYMLGRFCGKGSRALHVARLPLPPEQGKICASESLCLARPVEKNLDELAADMPQVRNDDAGYRWKLESLWPLLQSWLPGRGILGAFGNARKQNRCILLRFHRFLPYQQFPLISHWSTGRDFGKDTLMLYDCTADKQAIHALPRAECALYQEQVTPERFLALETKSIYFIEKL